MSGIPVRLDQAQINQLSEPAKAILKSLGNHPLGTETDPVHVNFDLSLLVSAISRVADALEKFLQPPVTQFSLSGGHFVRTYAENRPADTVAFRKALVVDSEGGAVDPQPDLSYTFSSDDESGVTVVDNGDSTVTVSYGTAKKLDDGSYKIFELKAESNTLTLTDGSTLKDVVTEQIQLIPGVASGFVGGGFALPDA